MPNPLKDWENLAVEILEHFRRRNIFWETTERRVSYHVFLPEDSFLSKILNVPLKKHPVPFTRSRCGRSARVYVCTARRRKKGTDRHVTFDANSSKCQIPAGTEAAGLEKERNGESCVPWSRRFDQWGTTRRRFAASSTTRSSFVSHPLLSPSPPSCHSLPCFFVRSIFPPPSATLDTRSNCQSSCNDLEKASFERNRLVEALGNDVPTITCIRVVYLVANVYGRVENQRNSKGQRENYGDSLPGI